ncbi:hypothetical protein TARUN_9913 [Trichoderma arundinaceum]|uniref:Uncharacterized protein n=1 Tax=Trichoderma arundinaceum TaxID=490622 RepID=A0A395N896_TRIAR|nr:hypothetical protein TARUN_9913 [Trichoderma arundinaceum]
MGLSAIIDTLRPCLHYVSLLGRLFTFPVRLAYIPLSYLLSVLGVVFAPAIYLFAYIASWCRGVIDFIVALQLGTAAAVGIFAGFTLATSSTAITSYLGMQDGAGGGSEEARSRSLQAKKSLSPFPSPSLTKDDSSSNEGEWYWPDPSSHSRRRPATGLMSQTILEEEDDSDI